MLLEHPIQVPIQITPITLRPFHRQIARRVLPVRKRLRVKLTLASGGNSAKCGSGIPVVGGINGGNVVVVVGQGWR